MSTFNNVLLSTAYLPNIEYFYYIINAKNIFIERFETYPKQTYRNRAKIYTANGTLDLSIPISKAYGNHTQINDAKISYDDPWQKKHWRAIESAYNSSPFFLYYKDDLEVFFTKPMTSLIQFNESILKNLFKLIGINKTLNYTQTFERNNTSLIDLRNYFDPKKENERIQIPKYYQVFEEKHGEISNLSIIDLLFNEGPNTLNILKQIIFN